MDARLCFTLCTLAAFSLTACTTTPVPAVSPVLPEKYSCLTFPNSADQAGAILRTVDGALAAQLNIDPGNLVRAFSPAGPSSILSGDFVDFQEDVSSGVSGTLAVQVFKKLGGSLNIKADATYSISVKASDNKQYTADDNQRQATLQSLYKAEDRIEGARYFFVKEAIGSRNLTYQVKTDIGINGSANLSADNSSLSADVTAKDGTTTVSTTNKELIACVVLEEFKFDVVHGANGAVLLSASPLAPTLSKPDAQDVLVKATTR